MKRTQRVGAHRSTSASGWPRWAILLAALAVTIVLIAVGLFALDMMRPQAPAPSPTTAPETITDPSAIDPSLDASITVLDASGERSFAAGVGQALADEGWTVIATGGSTEPADTTIVWFDADASRRVIDDDLNAKHDKLIAAYNRGLAAALNDFGR